VGLIIKLRLSVVASTLALFNEVNRHRAWLLLVWVTVYGQVNHLGIWRATQVNTACVTVK